MTRIKKALCLMLTLCMILGLVACGGKKETSSGSAETNSKDFIYSMKEIPLQLEGADLSDIFVINNKIYAYGMQYDYPEDDGMIDPKDMLRSDMGNPELDTASAETTVSTEEEATTEETTTTEEADEQVVDEIDSTKPIDEDVSGTMKLIVGVFNLDGTIESTFGKTFNSNSGMSCVTADSQGNIYVVLDEYGKDSSDPENVKDVFTLFSYNKNGEENWNMELGDGAKPEDMYYVNQLIIDHNDNIIIKSSTGIEVYGKDSKKISEMVLDEANKSGNLLLMKDNTLALISYGDSNVSLKKIDLANNKVTDGQDFPFNSYNYSYFTSLTNDLLLTDSNGIYVYNDGDTALTKIMDYVDSDIMSTNLYSIRQLDEKSFIGTYYDDETSKTLCAKFTKVDPSTIKDREVLTLGCNYLDTDVRKHIIDYNKENGDYRIKVIDYSIYNTGDDYTVAQTKLNTDIISGNMPDILMMSSDMPVNSYVSKKLFADMNPLLEGDAELKKEDYLQNVFDALSTDGKLYQIAPSFYVFTVFGKASEVGETSGWTFDDLQKLMDSKGPDVVSFSDVTRQDILNYSMWFCNSQLINWQTGECSFNSDGFLKTLEFANQFPKEVEYPEDADDSYWQNYQTMYREGRALLMMYTFSTFDDYNNCEKGTFGEKITPIGFPSDNKNGNTLNFNLDFAISAKSKNQKEAWNFVRYFLTDEYQDQLEYGFPVKLSSLDAQAKKAQEKLYYLDENGSKVEYDNTYNLNGVDVNIDPMTQEETDNVTEFIKSVTQVMNYNTNITDIVNEESTAYFEGQKTAKEVADIIQSRVQIYVNENR